MGAWELLGALWPWLVVVLVVMLAAVAVVLVAWILWVVLRSVFMAMSEEAGRGRDS